MGKKTLDDFRATYDRSQIVPARIKAALAELGDSYETEGDFIRRVKCSQSEFGRYREPFMAAHTIEVAGRNSAKQRVWCGTAKFAAQCRKVLENV